MSNFNHQSSSSFLPDQCNAVTSSNCQMASAVDGNIENPTPQQVSNSSHGTPARTIRIATAIPDESPNSDTTLLEILTYDASGFDDLNWFAHYGGRARPPPIRRSYVCVKNFYLLSETFQQCLTDSTVCIPISSNTAFLPVLIPPNESLLPALVPSNNANPPPQPQHANSPPQLQHRANSSQNLIPQHPYPMHPQPANANHQWILPRRPTPVQPFPQESNRPYSVGPQNPSAQPLSNQLPYYAHHMPIPQPANLSRQLVNTGPNTLPPAVTPQLANGQLQFAHQEHSINSSPYHFTAGTVGIQNQVTGEANRHQPSSSRQLSGFYQPPIGNTANGGMSLDFAQRGHVTGAGSCQYGNSTVWNGRQRNSNYRANLLRPSRNRSAPGILNLNTTSASNGNSRRDSSIVHAFRRELLNSLERFLGEPQSEEYNREPSQPSE